MASLSLTHGPGADELRRMSCGGKCSKNTPRVPEEELPARLAAIPEWQMSPDKTCITRKFVAKNFVIAMKYFQSVADIAEAEGHHPDLHLTGYRNVEMSLSTHAINGLSLFDFIMASKIDALEVEYSPKWLKQREEAKLEEQKQN